MSFGVPTPDPDDVPSVATAATYRRQARKLRHRFRKDPIALHLSLKDLATQIDSASDSAPTHAASRRATPVGAAAVGAGFRTEAVRPSPLSVASAGRWRDESIATGSRSTRSDDAAVAPAHRVKVRVIDPAVPPTRRADDVAAENVHAARMVERQTATIAAGLDAPAAVVEQFSASVRSMLGEGILRYDQRRDVYRQAALLRIDRFEASLIIAAIEHRHGLGQPGSRSARGVGRSGGLSVATVVGLVLLAEAAAAGLVFRLLF